MEIALLDYMKYRFYPYTKHRNGLHTHARNTCCAQSHSQMNQSSYPGPTEVLLGKSGYNSHL